MKPPYSYTSFKPLGMLKEIQKSNYTCIKVYVLWSTYIEHALLIPVLVVMHFFIDIC